MTTHKSGVALAVVLAIGATAGVAKAVPIGVGPRLNVELDGGDFAIGVEARFGVLQIANAIRLDVRPSFDYYFIDAPEGIDITLLGIAGDALFAFNIGNPLVEPYALAGLSIGFVSVDSDFSEADGSETDIGFNLGGGAKFLTNGNIQPYAELRVTIGDFDPILLGGGVLFFF